MQNSVAKKIFAVGSAVAMTLVYAAPLAATATAHAAGTNVSDSSGTVWMIMPNGTRQAYTSAGAFLSYGFNSWSQVVPASAEDLALPAGSFIPPQDGSIVCSDRGGDKGTCYEISNGQKFGFTSAAVFTGLGFSFSNALSGDVSWMPAGSMLLNNTTAAHLPGTLVNNNGTVQLMGNGGVLGIPDLNTFNSWGYSFGKVVPANAADKAMTQTGVMAVRTPGQLSPIAMTSGTTNPGNGNTTTPVGPISVSLSSSNPASSQIVQGQVAAPLASYTFSGNGTVTGLTLQRTGVSSNNLLKNVFLYSGAHRLTDSASVNSTGGISFANGTSLFTVNGTMTVSVMADIICGTSSCGTPFESDSGQTVGVQLTGVTLAGNMVASGVPISGNLFNVSSAPSLASVQVSGLTPQNGSTPTVNPGPAQVVWQANFNVANTNVNFTRMALREIGSVYPTDVQNFVLNVDGNLVAQSQSMDSNNYVTLAPSVPYLLTTGAHTVQVLADINSGAGRNFEMSLQQNADLGLTDTSYNVGIAIGGSTVPPITAGQFTVNSASNGSYTLQVASSSPTSNVSYNAIGQTLGSWVVTTYGEPIKITSLNVGFNYATGTGNSNTNATLRNGYITINGAQYGSTQSVACTSSTGIAASTCSSNSSTSFQVNYIVQPGQPIVVAFHADLFDNDGTGQLANGDTIQVKLVKPGSQNAQGQTSLQTVYLPAADSTAYLVTVTTGSISGVKNGSYADQTTVAPQNNLYKLGSFYINGSSNEAVNINSINIGFGTVSGGVLTASSGMSSLLTNVQLTWNGTTENQVKGTVVSSSNLWSVNHQIPVNGSALVEVWADILPQPSPVLTTQITTALQATGLTASSGQSADTGTLQGQTVNIAGNGSLSVQQDGTSPLAALLTANQTGVPTAAFKLQATNDTFNITDLVFTVASQTTASTLYVYSSVNGASPTLVVSKGVGSGTVTFSGLNIQIPANGTDVITTKVDVGNVGQGAGSPADNLLTTLAGIQVTGSNGTRSAGGTLGNSNALAGYTAITGNPLYVFKALPSVTTVALPNTVLASGLQTIYKFTVTAGAQPISWNQVKFGVNLSSGVTSTGFSLIDDSTNNAIASCSGTTTVTCTVNSPSTNEQQVSSTKTYDLQTTIGGTIVTGSSVGVNISKVSTGIATPGTTTTLDGTSASFVWSDLSASPHSTGSSDWNNDYLISLSTQTENMTK